MADKLIKCVTCGSDVAKSANACPNCGAKPKKSFFNTLNGKLIKYIIILFIFIGVDYVFNSRSLPTNSQTPVTNDTSRENLSEILNNSVNGSKIEENDTPLPQDDVDNNDTINNDITEIEDTSTETSTEIPTQQ